MNENIENKSNNIKNLIGIMLVMPVYVVFFSILRFLIYPPNYIAYIIIIPWLISLPIIIGMFLSYKKYKDKTSKIIGICILIFLCLTIYFYYNAYLIEHQGWDALGYFVYMIGTAVICKILTFIFYGKIVGWKRSLAFFGIYILVICIGILGIVIANQF